MRRSHRWRGGRPAPPAGSASGCSRGERPCAPDRAGTYERPLPPEERCNAFRYPHTIAAILLLARLRSLWSRDPAGGRSGTIRLMRRLLPLLVLALTVLLVAAPAALAHDGGQGTYGVADDKVVTSAGFILIAFFPLFVFAMSMLQMALDRRKERRKAVHKALAREDRVRGGW